MPRYRPETEKQKAKTLANLYVSENMNQARVAEREGVSRAAVNQRIHRTPVQEAIIRNLAKAGITQKKIYKRLDEELDAEKSISAVILVDKAGKVVKADDEGGIMIPDHTARDRAIEKCLILIGHLKQNGKEENGKGNGSITIQIIRPLGSNTNERIHVNRT